jgi:hypothetical protein
MCQCWRLSRAILTAAALASACDRDISGPNTIAPSAANGVFVGKVYPDGRTRWPFEMTSPGTVTLSFDALDPPVRLGLALGDLTGKDCRVTDEIESPGGPSAARISAASGAGEKCIEVFDVGAAPESGVSFTVAVHAS